MSDDLPMSPSVAADKLLSWKGRFRGKKLLRRILAHEKLTGREIAKRVPRSNGMMCYLITKSKLIAELPELFDSSVDTIANQVHARIDSIGETVSLLVDEAVSHRLSAIESLLTNLRSASDRERTCRENAVRELSKRINVLEKRVV